MNPKMSRVIGPGVTPDRGIGPHGSSVHIRRAERVLTRCRQNASAREFRRVEKEMKRFACALAASLLLACTARAADINLLNVSYDPTRELYAHLGKAFADRFKADNGKTIEVKTSNGGSGAQARAVIDGLQAD